MTNYNKRLDEIFAPLIDSPSLTLTTTYWGGAKQAITSLIKELVAEAKPGRASTQIWRENPDDAWDMAINQFEQDLLKALEEV